MLTFPLIWNRMVSPRVLMEIMEAKDASGEVLGYAINITTPEGYGGDIAFSLGVQSDGDVKWN